MWIKENPSFFGKGTYDEYKQHDAGKVSQDRNAYYASQAAYGSSQHQQKLFDNGYQIDESLSNNKYRVYHKNGTEAIVAYRGTSLEDKEDLEADAGLAVYNYNTAGFRTAKSVADQARSKYGKLLHVGHSLGGSKALNNAYYANEKATVFNPGTSAFGTYTGHNKVYTSEGDPIASRVVGYNITRVPGISHSIDQYEGLFQ